MRLPDNCPVDNELVKKYKAFIERLREPIQRSRLPHLYCVLLQASNEVDQNKVLLSKDRLHRFSGDLLSKMLNEGWGFIGCYERGAYLAAYHHARACIELLAGYHWAVFKKSKREKKVRRYFEFKELYLYNLFREYSSSAPEVDLESLPGFSQDRIVEWESKKDDWARLFKVEADELSSVRNWHHGASIENMLSTLPDDGRTKRTYDVFCHATHFSPHTHALGTGDTVLGLPIGMDGDVTKLNELTQICINVLLLLYKFIGETTDFDSKVKFPKEKS